ncbi:MAG: histidinol-phosphate transaminase [Lachnospiraceae bacterium]
MDWEKNVRKVVPYVPGEQPNQSNMIKLNTNECPYPPSPMVEEAIKAIEVDSMRLYPDPGATALVESIAAYYGFKKEQVFVGVGSDDVLAMAFMTFFHGNKPILFPDITYSFYDVWADLLRIPYRCQPLDEAFRIVPADYKIENGGIIFPNPNAPTGVEESTQMIEDILRANPNVVVIIDEAYIDFGAKSVLSLVNQYDNLLVVQTFSKSRAMAGMRIGFAIGSRRLIHYLNDVKFSFNSYTMNRPTLVCGVAAVLDDVYFKKITTNVIHTRERVKKELSELGFHFADSKGNFIFATHPGYAAQELWMALQKSHIYVRYFNKPRIDNYLRISIGTDEEMDALLSFLKEYIVK